MWCLYLSAHVSTNKVELNRASLGSKFQHRIIIFVQRSLTASLYVCIWPPCPHPSWTILSPEASRSSCFQASSGEDRRDTADPVTVSTQRSQLASWALSGSCSGFAVMCHMPSHLRDSGCPSLSSSPPRPAGLSWLSEVSTHPFCLRHYKSVDSNCGLTKELVCDSV